MKESKFLQWLNLPAKMSCKQNFNNPPLLPSDGSGYNIWKNEVDLWCEVTKIPANNRAITIYFSLEGKAKTTASHIKKGLLKTTDGVSILLEALDKVFIPNTAMRLFNAHNYLRSIKRKPNGLVHDYLTAYEHALFQFEQEGLAKDATVLGLDLLAQCQLPQEKNMLVMSGLTEITYENVKAKLSAIYYYEHDKYNKFEDSESREPEEVFYSRTQNNRRERNKFEDSESREPEEVFYSRTQNNQQGRSSNYRAGFENRSRKRPRYNRSGNSYGNNDSVKPPAYRTKNPNGNDGRPSRCNICQSIYHWFRNCPHAHERNGTTEHLKEKSNQVNFSGLVAFTGLAEENTGTCKIRLLREETKGCAIVDSGCATPVCGMGWMDEFIENLCDEEKNNIKEAVSTETFTFGDGSTVKSLKKVTFPCWISGKRGFITTDVVECGIPLLLSRKTLKTFKMVLDFENDTMTYKGRTDRAIPLVNTKSGHYALPLTL